MKGLRKFAVYSLWMLAASSGCATHTGTGALTGGLIGAGLGAGIGKATGNTAAGALIGTGIGTAAGGLIGDQADRDELAAERRAAAIQQAAHTPPPPPRMTLNEVITMTRQGCTDNLIVNQIYSTGSVFYLSTQDVIDLHNAGVSNGVIQAMSNTARRPPPQRTVIVERDPIYVYEPPPRVHIGFGYGCGPRYHRRCW